VANFFIVCDSESIIPCLKELAWGGTERDIVKRFNIQIGDRIMIYVKAKSPLGKAAMFCGDFVISGVNDNLESESFFAEFNKHITLTPTSSLVYQKFISAKDELAMIKNKQYWGMTFMGRSIVQIPDNDFEYLVGILEKSGIPIRM
jgi:predicted RNA-binding protein